jgi:hypothetical protein
MVDPRSGWTDRAGGALFALLGVEAAWEGESDLSGVLAVTKLPGLRNGCIYLARVSLVIIVHG